MINGTHDLTHPGGYTLSPELRLPCGHHHCPGKVHFDGTWYSSWYDQSIPQKKAGTFHCQVRLLESNIIPVTFAGEPSRCCCTGWNEGAKNVFPFATTHLMMLQLMVKHSHHWGISGTFYLQSLASCPTMATGWERPAAWRYTVNVTLLRQSPTPFFPLKRQNLLCMLTRMAQFFSAAWFITSN